MTVTEDLQRQIREVTKNCRGIIPEMSMLAISDDAAWQFAGEMAQLSLLPSVTMQSDIYQGMKDGGSRFMGWSIVVAVDANPGPPSPSARPPQ